MPDDIARIKLKHGETAARQKGKMLAIKWKDKKYVSLLSTVHNSSMVTVRARGNEEVRKLCVVVSYKISLGRWQSKFSRHTSHLHYLGRLVVAALPV